jgi:hypothetical protein
VRSGRWKLHFPHDYFSLQGRPGGSAGKPAAYQKGHTDLALFDLDKDPGETTNVAEQHPEIVEKLKKRADEARAELGDSATQTQGKGVRPAGRF